MFPTIKGEMTLKDIMEIHPRLEDRLRTYGFDICCAKMETLADACARKNIPLTEVLRDLNAIVEELNLVESIIEDSENG